VVTALLEELLALLLIAEAILDLLEDTPRLELNLLDELAALELTAELDMLELAALDLAADETVKLEFAKLEFAKELDFTLTAELILLALDIAFTDDATTTIGLAELELEDIGTGDV
jgi:hypothetical protein